MKRGIWRSKKHRKTICLGSNGSLKVHLFNLVIKKENAIKGLLTTESNREVLHPLDFM